MRNQITLSKAIFFFGISFILGIFFAPSSILLGVFFVFFLYLGLIFREKNYERKRNKGLAVFCLVFFLFGAYYFHYKDTDIPKDISLPVHGVVKEPPSVQGNLKRIVFEHENGRALLYVDRYKEYDYGDFLKVNGNFNIVEDEGYANYLKKEGVYHTSFYPEIKKKGERKTFFYNQIFSLRGKIKNNIQKSIPSPENFLLEAMILGDRSSFTEDFNKKLSISGTRHISAVSGMHIVVISGIFFYIFQFLKIERKKATILSLFCIFLFIIFVGAPASAIRAGIMGSIYLFSFFFCRENNSFRTIVFSAGVMLLLNPLLLHYDLGFQLSFLAVTGIIFLSPLIKRYLTLENKRLKGFFAKNELIADLLSVTISAQALVFPLILYNFGHFSLVSVFTNILIVPLLPFIMILGIIVGITGFSLFAFLLIVLLSFVLLVIEFFSSLSFSAIYIDNVPLLYLFLFYLFVFYKIYEKQRKTKRENLYTPI